MNFDISSPDFSWQDEGTNLIVYRGTLALNGLLELYDSAFDGEDEYPMWDVILEDGTKESLHSFDKWATND